MYFLDGAIPCLERLQGLVSILVSDLIMTFKPQLLVARVSLWKVQPAPESRLLTGPGWRSACRKCARVLLPSTLLRPDCHQAADEFWVLSPVCKSLCLLE